MRQPKISPLRECTNCGNGIGLITYKSSVIQGEYCSSDCYGDALCELTGGMKGKFKLVTIRGGGVELVSLT
mgnify:CR=1 FL=1